MLGMTVLLVTRLTQWCRMRRLPSEMRSGPVILSTTFSGTTASARCIWEARG